MQNVLLTNGKVERAFEPDEIDYLLTIDRQRNSSDITPIAKDIVSKIVEVAHSPNPNQLYFDIGQSAISAQLELEI